MALAGLPSENKASCRNSGRVIGCIVELGSLPGQPTQPHPTVAHNLGAWKSPPALKMARTPLLGPPPKFHSCFDAHLTSPLPVLNSVCLRPERAVGGGTSWLGLPAGLSRDSQTVNSSEDFLPEKHTSLCFLPLGVSLQRKPGQPLLLIPSCGLQPPGLPAPGTQGKSAATCGQVTCPW